MGDWVLEVVRRVRYWDRQLYASAGVLVHVAIALKRAIGSYGIVEIASVVVVEVICGGRARCPTVLIVRVRIRIVPVIVTIRISRTHRASARACDRGRCSTCCRLSVGHRERVGQALGVR